MAKRTVEWESKGADRVIRDTRSIRDEEKKLRQEQEAAEKQAKETASAQLKRSEAARNAFLGVAGAIAVVVARGAEAVATYAKMDAAEGRLQRSIGKTVDAADRQDAAFKRAQATFRDWEGEFGVSAEKQTNAMLDLTEATGNYEQSLSDVSLAIDISAAKGIEFERAAEAVRKVRQGEVEVLKELGVLTKKEAEDLAKVTNEAQRTRDAVTKLTQAFGGGAEGTKGLQTTLDATHAKLERTEQLVGSIAAKLVEDGTGLVAAMGEFIGVLDEGEHPLDELNDRLSVLAGHAENGDWEKLAGVLMLGNPATMGAGLALLGINSQGGGSPAAPPPGAIPQGQMVDEVPEPGAGNFSTAVPNQKTPGRRDPNAGSDALTGKDTPSDFELMAIIHEEAYGKQVEAQRAAEEAKREEYNKTVEIHNEGQKFVQDLEAKTAKMKQENADIEKANAKEKAKANQMVVDSAFAAAEGAKGLANQFIKDEGAKAVLEGGMQVAYAIANWANPPAAIAHGAAAAQFFAVAAQAGVGGGGSKRAAGGSGAAAASAASPTRTPEQNEASAATAFGTGVGSRGGMSGLTVNVHLNSISKPSAREQRVIGQAVANEARMLVGGSW